MMQFKQSFSFQFGIAFSTPICISGRMTMTTHCHPPSLSVLYADSMAIHCHHGFSVLYHTPNTKTMLLGCKYLL